MIDKELTTVEETRTAIDNAESVNRAIALDDNPLWHEIDKPTAHAMLDMLMARPDVKDGKIPNARFFGLLDLNGDLWLGAQSEEEIP